MNKKDYIYDAVRLLTGYYGEDINICSSHRYEINDSEAVNIDCDGYGKHDVFYLVKDDSGSARTLHDYDSLSEELIDEIVDKLTARLSLLSRKVNNLTSMRENDLLEN